MIICNGCGAEVEEGRVICPSCGSILVNQKPAKSSAKQRGKAEKVQKVQESAQEVEESTAQPTKQKTRKETKKSKDTEVSQGNETVSIGEWFGLFLISMVPFLNIIMTFVWAFGKKTKPSKKNYCRFLLIMNAIVIILMIVLFVVMGASMAALVPEYSNMTQW